MSEAQAKEMLELLRAIAADMTLARRSSDRTLELLECVVSGSAVLVVMPPV